MGRAASALYVSAIGREITRPKIAEVRLGTTPSSNLMAE
jgi:hypothetical protein